MPPDAWLAILYYVFLVSVLAYFLSTWGNTRVHVPSGFQPAGAVAERSQTPIIMRADMHAFNLHAISC